MEEGEWWVPELQSACMRPETPPPAWAPLCLFKGVTTLSTLQPSIKGLQTCKYIFSHRLEIVDEALGL